MNRPSVLVAPILVAGPVFRVIQIRIPVGSRNSADLDLQHAGRSSRRVLSIDKERLVGTIETGAFILSSQLK